MSPPKPVTLRVQFQAQIFGNGEAGASTIDGVKGISTTEVGAEAAKILQDKLSARVAAAVKTHEHAKSQQVIMTKEGTVLVCYYNGYCWGYDTHSSWGHCGYWETIDSSPQEALARARKHAQEKLGGIVWESLKLRSAQRL